MGVVLNLSLCLAPLLKLPGSPALCGRSLVGSGTEGLLAKRKKRPTTPTHFGVRHSTADRRGEGASCPQNLWETAPQPMGREGTVGSSTMKCRGDFISNRTWAERLQGCLFPQLHPEGLGGTSPSSQPRSHLQPSLAQSPGLFVCRAAEEESGSRERVRGGGSAAELIKSFKGDGELSQVHIKGQGNEC